MTFIFIIYSILKIVIQFKSKWSPIFLGITQDINNYLMNEFDKLLLIYT